MAISSSITGAGAELTIGIERHFDFSSHQDFRHAYEGLSAKPIS
ncbi:MAG: hypothetical protein ACJAYG_002223 [Oceanicoccus sp.]|jgi:hypothetical protein